MWDCTTHHQLNGPAGAPLPPAARTAASQCACHRQTSCLYKCLDAYLGVSSDSSAACFTPLRMSLKPSSELRSDAAAAGGRITTRCARATKGRGAPVRLPVRRALPRMEVALRAMMTEGAGGLCVWYCV